MTHCSSVAQIRVQRIRDKVEEKWVWIIFLSYSCKLQIMILHAIRSMIPIKRNEFSDLRGRAENRVRKFILTERKSIFGFESNLLRGSPSSKLRYCLINAVWLIVCLIAAFAENNFWIFPWKSFCTCLEVHYSAHKFIDCDVVRDNALNY